MDPTYVLTDFYLEGFVQARRRAAAEYQLGTGSTAVAMIARAAAGLRRLSTRVERWASGPAETTIPARRHVSIR